MSLKTWKEEFMPTEACDTSKEEAYDHVLRKWIGLREENLRRHGLRRFYASIRGKYNDIPYSMSVDCSTCAFCLHYLKPAGVGCGSCPLFKSLGASCDRRDGGYPARSPYDEFLLDGNPEPMISAILMSRYGITMKQVYANE